MIHELMVFYSMLLLQRKNGFRTLMHRIFGRGLVIYFFLAREEGNKSFVYTYVDYHYLRIEKVSLYYFLIVESVGMNMLYVTFIINHPEGATNRCLVAISL